MHYLTIIQACLIVGAVTILGILSFWLMPPDRWLPHEQVQKMYDGANGEPVNAVSDKKINVEDV